VGEFQVEAGRVGHDITGEVQVLSNWKWVSVLAFAAVAAACGGGGEPTARGAIAIGTATGTGFVVTNYTSQPEANSDAVRECVSFFGGAGGCVVVLEFSGNGTCGSVARGSNGVWGAASGSSKESADSRAVSDCVAKGGGGCFVPDDFIGNQCN
jgi:hypothetical protein